jgi:hypothetical protein
LQSTTLSPRQTAAPSNSGHAAVTCFGRL